MAKKGMKRPSPEENQVNLQKKNKNKKEVPEVK